MRSGTEVEPEAPTGFSAVHRDFGHRVDLSYRNADGSFCTVSVPNCDANTDELDVAKRLRELAAYVEASAGAQAMERLEHAMADYELQYGRPPTEIRVSRATYDALLAVWALRSIDGQDVATFRGAKIIV